MDLKKRYIFITLIFITLFIFLEIYLYQKSKENALTNAQNNIKELLLNYKALRTYISQNQREAVYDLQAKGSIGYHFFNPNLMSSSYGVRKVNQYYNQFRNSVDKKPIYIKFASNHPRNPKNKASVLESEVLKRFQNGTIKSFQKIIKKDGEKYLFYALPTKRNEAKCMACHSNPSVAPKDLVDRYGDSAGFYEQEGDMRAILSTYYPMSDELFSSQKSFIKVSIGIFFVFAILLGVIYYILKQFEIKNKKLQLLNQSLDDEVGERTQELLNEKIFLKNILDISPNLIIVIDKHKIYKANETFYKFFGIEKAEEFEDKYGMLCSHFSLVDKTFSYEDRPHNPDDWYSFFIEHHNEEHTISLTKGDKKHYFNISASVLKQDQFVMNLRDITLLREKENIIIQQTKMESMGEMLTNIAHQWRQPLSMISTVATGVIAQKEIGILTDEKLIKSLDSINQSTQNMSNIIDEFSSFYQVQKDMSYIKNIKLIEKTLKLADNNLKKSVKIVLDIQEATIYGLENEIIQVVLNMLNNAKEILFHRDIEKKIIKISSFETQDAVLISVHDSGNGIPEDIKQKVFEPYFTTKHQKQGVGIGLYMSYEIISFYMDGDITVENDMFDDGDNKYFGAKFTISIPKKK